MVSSLIKIRIQTQFITKKVQYKANGYNPASAYVGCLDFLQHLFLFAPPYISASLLYILHFPTILVHPRVFLCMFFICCTLSFYLIFYRCFIPNKRKQSIKEKQLFDDWSVWLSMCLGVFAWKFREETLKGFSSTSTDGWQRWCWDRSWRWKSVFGTPQKGVLHRQMPDSWLEEGGRGGLREGKWSMEQAEGL